MENRSPLSLPELIYYSALCAAFVVLAFWGGMAGECLRNDCPELDFASFWTSTAFILVPGCILAFVIISFTDVVRSYIRRPVLVLTFCGVVSLLIEMVFLRFTLFSDFHDLLSQNNRPILLIFSLLALTSTGVALLRLEFDSGEHDESVIHVSFNVFALLIACVGIFTFSISLIFVANFYEPKRAYVPGDPDFEALFELDNTQLNGFSKLGLLDKFSKASAVIFVQNKEDDNGNIRKYVIEVLKTTPVSGFEKNVGEFFDSDLIGDKSPDCDGSGSLLFFLGRWHEPILSTPIVDLKLSLEGNLSLDKARELFADISIEAAPDEGEILKEIARKQEIRDEYAVSIGNVWGIEIGSASPREEAKKSIDSAKPEFLSFRWCLNDDACQAITLGVGDNTRCLLETYGAKVETYAFDVHTNVTKKSLRNVSRSAWRAGLEFSKAYNQRLTSLLLSRGEICPAP
jgi:hypothetical protein